MNENIKPPMGDKGVGDDTINTENQNNDDKVTVPAGGQNDDPRNVKKYSDNDLDGILSRKMARYRSRLMKELEGNEAETELEKKERDVARRELMLDCKDKLLSEGYPATLAQMVNYDSEEEFNTSYEYITTSFDEAVMLAVKDKLRGKTPTKGVPSPGVDDKIKQAFAPKHVNGLKKCQLI